MSISLCRPLIVVALAAGLGGGFSASAAAEPFTCSASALKGSIVGQAPIDPVTANAGQSACRSDAGSLSSALAAPLGAGAAQASTVLDGPGESASDQHASSTASVADFRIGALGSLPISLPAPQMPTGLDAVTVRLSSTLQGLGLPSSIVVDALPAARALVPSSALPDVALLGVRAVRSTASARCGSGSPILDGSSQVSGLTVLGQSWPADQPLVRSVGLIDSRSISLSGIDVNQVVLPAGLSYSQPVVGALLASAVRSALAGLPPIQIPATVAQVTTTPGQRSQADGTLVQQALRVQVSVLGTPVADLVLGEARVGGRSVSCASPIAAVAPRSAPAPASQLAVSCSRRNLTLINVVERSDHVALLGAADRRYIGRRVAIVFTGSGRQVASAVVRGDGFFRTQAPVPSEGIRHTNRARYVAQLDGQRSLALKLERRMRISALHHRGNRVLIVGRVTGPMGAPTIVLRQRVSCTHDVIVKRIHPRADGGWRVWLPAPRGQQAAMYRATTEVRKVQSNPRLFPTFTLPGYVSL
ncbi:MAG TPA: hypothetical protein VGN69_01275 [Solirubrobacteraceae bacterium]|jgi:hypothetical protein|nr:hypothetical protein [Solirubrobacteraceae bacterium]